MKKLLPVLASISICSSAFAQSIANNGQLDDFSELSTSYTVPFVMHDGVKLYTDIYMPILRDCLMVDVAIPVVNTTLKIQLLPKGSQLIQYDKVRINGVEQENPVPQQLPMVFSRTPYNKGDGNNVEGSVIALLGYAYAVQDMRGRYTSEGVYLPLMSDSWDKNPYHTYQHVLDVEPPTSPSNGNKHEDGYYSIKYITDSLFRSFDRNNDGIDDTTALWVNGRIGMFGASALGYNQYQAAAARKIDDSKPGLKCLLPIVAPNEFFKSTGFHNGILRDRLVTGWLKGQIFTGTDDDRIPEDELDASQNGYFNAVQNNIHSSFDYNLPNKFVAANLAIDHFVEVKYQDASGAPSLAGYYPSSIGRKDMDCSRAYVDANGNGKLDGEYSRYTNMEVPAYHLTGWWDIFTDGQIETWAYMRKYLDPSKKNRRLQKLIIGPWAHQTIGQTATGDLQYPDNVTDLIGLNFDDFDASQDIPISKALKSELIGWYRYNLNYQDEYYIGEPKAVIPSSKSWTVVADNFAIKTDVRIPANEVRLTYRQLLSLLNGSGGVPGVSVEIRNIIPLTGDTTYNTVTFDVPAFGTPLVKGLDNLNIDSIPYRDFMNEYDIPNVRFYVVGPNGDGVAENQGMGNYWLGTDTFPLASPWVTNVKCYLHPDGTFDLPTQVSVPTNVEDQFNIYVHDPDDPLRTCGGGNMIEQTPDGTRDSQGQMDFTSDQNRPFCLDRPGILTYTSPEVQDSLCIVGFPTATIYAKTNPGGANLGDPTDTDFFVRVLDVYPDGREFFVAEGGVNARAKEYVRALVDHPEWDQAIPYPIDTISFKNIETGKIYEYKFKMLPLGYTWGKGHKMKILISSSNFDRFQVNPNIPMNDGEFFRRKPGDGQTYTFQGVEYAPRVAVQRIAFSTEHPCNIELPVYTQQYVNTPDLTVTHKAVLDALVYPNPTIGDLTIFPTKRGLYNVNIFSIAGAQLGQLNGKNEESIKFDVSKLGAGVYFAEITNALTGEKVTKKFTKE
jgi:predicted acyl esterase